MKVRGAALIVTGLLTLAIAQSSPGYVFAQSGATGTKFGNTSKDSRQRIKLELGQDENLRRNKGSKAVKKTVRHKGTTGGTKGNPGNPQGLNFQKIEFDNSPTPQRSR